MASPTMRFANVCLSQESCGRESSRSSSLRKLASKVVVLIPTGTIRRWLCGSCVVARLAQPSRQHLQQYGRSKHRQGAEQIALRGSAEKRNAGGVGHHQ